MMLLPVIGYIDKTGTEVNQRRNHSHLLCQLNWLCNIATLIPDQQIQLARIIGTCLLANQPTCHETS